MRKYFCAIIGLLFCLNSAIAQEYYYWAYGKKFPLELYDEKQYVLIKNDNKELFAQGLGVSKQEVSDIKRLTVSKMIKNNRLGKSINDNDLY